MADDMKQDDGIKHPSAFKLLFTLKSPSERFSKFFNLIESFLVYIGIFYFTYRNIYENITPLETVLMNIILVYTIIGAYIHKNSSFDIGIANIKDFKKDLTNWRNKEVILTVLVLIGISPFVFLLIRYRFDDVMIMVPFLGMVNGSVGEGPVKDTLIIVEFIIFQVILIVLFIRKDNLYAALKDMAKPLLVVLTMIFGYGLTMAFISLFSGTGFTLIHHAGLDFLATWYSYTFSGLLQQIPFLVYLSTRFRKGLPAHRISEWLNIILISAYFGFFHGKQWELVIIAVSMEFILARSFLHDETRNLFAAAIVHGLVGAVIIFFTPIDIKFEGV